MRTQTEIRLMNLRQEYADYLRHLRSMPVIQLEEYKLVYVHYQTVVAALEEYRFLYKFKDIA